jgi:hypothetical protein
MADLPDDIASARDARSVTLQVASRRGDRVRGGHLNIAREAARVLREQAGRALDSIESMERRDYWPDANLAVNEQYFELQRADVEDTLGVLELLDQGADTPLLSVDDIAGRLLFYSIIVGEDAVRRVEFVSKSNPARELGRGTWLTRTLTPQGDTLTTVDTPLFLFEDRVDLIVGPDTIIVLNQLAFEQWFRESPAITEHVAKWISAIVRACPSPATAPSGCGSGLRPTSAFDGCCETSAIVAISQMCRSIASGTTFATRVSTRTP